MNQTTNIMGIPFPNITMDQTVTILGDVVDQRQSELFHVITGNPEIVMSCQKDQALRSVVDQAGLITADGAGIVMVSRFRGGQLTERVTGCDLLFRLLEEGRRKNWSFYMLGAEESVSKRAVEVITQNYPGVIVHGRHHGFFTTDEEQAIVEEIHEAQPDFLIVALGAPHAEYWINKYRHQLNARVAIGVGGSLDILAGKTKRAPAIWQKLNLEWLYRLLSQPSRWRRQLILPRFAVRALLFREQR
ncbi:N-acetylglucosaminyldiphosphoundecaprenol N-acetyl-beta-D-mannosaminyltransferase [Paenibacillus pabuli]|uniref:N-acetylglucosaminyldiphosphoundecaprenol N-acetyl-beta-D-mannosaminyltransferase n=1 Tax=Paenibacillus pabuli TaxID=1472 RepID=A0ABX9BB46_9BACL|nr:WecB/TagA/CpsF family glycosyltransferase [Paenibacillus pabuli]RAI83893.1 N-acetylglucosaminyldiphosphoundecaprenol N-acetyl-beta-D-mannosaminyltransferase [Paenibacillus pabuli]